MSQPAIQMDNICKRFGTVLANQNVSFSVQKGEIHALLGENGAGKSTLMNMLSGIYAPDAGAITVHGEQVLFTSPKHAIDKGIGMIQQHFKLVDVLTAAENIVAGRPQGLFVHRKKLFSKIKLLCEKYALDIDPAKKIYMMSVGEKQTVEIIKVLYRGADILILDEPTAVLTPQESDRLFEILDNMRKMGCAIIIITHKLAEVMAIADRITVLRKGEAVATVQKTDTSIKQLTDLMVGRQVDLSIERPLMPDCQTVLQVSHLTVLDDDKVEALKDVSFSVASGEILGVAGVAGSGQKELCEVIAGLYKVTAGDITFENESIVGLKPRDIIKKGISMSFIPEDRLGMGLVGAMGMVDNLILKEYQNSKGLFVDRKTAAVNAVALVKRLDIQTPSIYTPVKMLSGGNIQKVLVGRELSADLHVLITAYPVRGLDINSSFTIYDILNEQKKKGVAILYVGEDLDVLLELCDRIMVLCNGKVTGIVHAKSTTKEQVGLMMAGETEVAQHA
ncbi:MAG: ABC transporter ATP-binding protein [Hyphomonadaceae bacterium]|nr:ABC transporter ATP-binding protein [Clostridia bacterium]